MNLDTLNEKLKGAYKSLTMWINGLVGAAILALPEIKDGFPEVRDYLAPSFFQWSMGALVVANLILRIKTTKSLADK